MSSQQPQNPQQFSFAGSMRNQAQQERIIQNIGQQVQQAQYDREVDYQREEVEDDGQYQYDEQEEDMEDWRRQMLANQQQIQGYSPNNQFEDEMQVDDQGQDENQQEYEQQQQEDQEEYEQQQEDQEEYEQQQQEDQDQQGYQFQEQNSNDKQDDEEEENTGNNQRNPFQQGYSPQQQEENIQRHLILQQQQKQQLQQQQKLQQQQLFQQQYQQYQLQKLQQQQQQHLHQVNEDHENVDEDEIPIKEREKIIDKLKFTNLATGSLVSNIEGAIQSDQSRSQLISKLKQDESYNEPSHLEISQKIVEANETGKEEDESQNQQQQQQEEGQVIKPSKYFQKFLNGESLTDSYSILPTNQILSSVQNTTTGPIDNFSQVPNQKVDIIKAKLFESNKQLMAEMDTNKQLKEEILEMKSTINHLNCQLKSSQNALAQNQKLQSPQQPNNLFTNTFGSSLKSPSFEVQSTAPINEISSKLEEEKTKNVSLRKDLEGLRTRLLQEMNNSGQYEQQIRESENTIKDIQFQNQQKDQLLQEKTDELKRIANNGDTFRVEITSLNAKLKKTQITQDDIEASKRELLQENQQLKSDMKILSVKLSNFSQDNHRLFAEIQSLKQKVEKAEGQVTESQNSLYRQQTENNSGNNQSNQQRTKQQQQLFEKHSAELNDLKQLLNSTIKQLEAEKDKNQFLKSRLEDQETHFGKDKPQRNERQIRGVGEMQGFEGVKKQEQIYRKQIQNQFGKQHHEQMQPNYYFKEEVQSPQLQKQFEKYNHKNDGFDDFSIDSNWDNKQHQIQQQRQQQQQQQQQQYQLQQQQYPQQQQQQKFNYPLNNQIQIQNQTYDQNQQQFYPQNQNPFLPPQKQQQQQLQYREMVIAQQNQRNQHPQQEMHSYQGDPQQHQQQYQQDYQRDQLNINDPFGNNQENEIKNKKIVFSPQKGGQNDNLFYTDLEEEKSKLQKQQQQLPIGVTSINEQKYLSNTSKIKELDNNLSKLLQHKKIVESELLKLEENKRKSSQLIQHKQELESKLSKLSLEVSSVKNELRSLHALK